MIPLIVYMFHVVQSNYSNCIFTDFLTLPYSILYIYFILPQTMSKEKREAAINQKIEEIRKKNENITRRYQVLVILLLIVT